MNGGYVGRRKINIMTPGATHFQRKLRKSIALDTRVGERNLLSKQFDRSRSEEYRIQMRYKSK